MTKLEELYTFIDKQKQSGEITPAQEEIYRKVEELLIMEDATFRIAKAVAPELSSIRRSVSFIVDYNLGGKVRVRPVFEGSVIEGESTITSTQVSLDAVPFHNGSTENCKEEVELVSSDDSTTDAPINISSPILITSTNTQDAESHNLRITIDGKVYQEKNAIRTFIRVLQHIGLEKVATVGIICSGYNLVDTRKRTEKNRRWQQQVDGKWVYVYFSNQTKCKYLFQIAESLQKKIRIEAV